MPVSPVSSVPNKRYLQTLADVPELGVIRGEGQTQS